MPAAEIIQRHTHSQVAKQTQLFARLFRVVHQGFFRDLELQMTRLQAMTFKHLAQFSGQIGHAELRAAQTDAHDQVFGK
ncbi:hypothetical protein D3C80_1804840 [compost metagenome]